MNKEFRQISWDKSLEHHWRAIVRLAVREDLDRTYDWTTVALVPGTVEGHAAVVARQTGVIAGLPAARAVTDEMECPITWTDCLQDGTYVEADDEIARLSGPARDLLTAERLILNVIGRLSGIATLTRRYVDAVKNTKARVYDTRKTTPGWRGLEKYAVRCGGGMNHRSGLYEAILIKDNHLAVGAGSHSRRFGPAEAVEQTRRLVKESLPTEQADQMIIEVEVDCLEQLDQVLKSQPDIVLLDNMTPEQLRVAVARRDRAGTLTELEASGGVDLNTIGAIAETGVDRISVGALTHSAANLDVGMDWRD